MTIDSGDGWQHEGGLYEERLVDSSHIESVWQARAVRDERYLVLLSSTGISGSPGNPMAQRWPDFPDRRSATAG